MSTTGDVLAVDRVEVGPAALEATVRVVDESRQRTCSVPGLADRAVELLPGLARHTCENESGLDALREFADTETPHLLEHVASELMALAGSPRSLRGATEWDFARDGRGVFRVRLEFDDDLVALGALREAHGVVEWLMAGERQGDSAASMPDVSAAVARLRAVRSRPAP